MSRSQLFQFSWILVLAAAAGLLYGLLMTGGSQDGASVTTRNEGQLPPAAPVELPSKAAIASLKIDAIGVSGPVIVLTANSDGIMDTPSEPMDVAWYDFSAYPGRPGNAVFAGHVDHQKTGPAVFHDLRKVKAGDSVKVLLADGTLYSYAVTSLHTYFDATAPIQEIIGPTERESITLITCIGSFDPVTRTYDQRLIVRAERLEGSGGLDTQLSSGGRPNAGMTSLP